MRTRAAMRLPGLHVTNPIGPSNLRCTAPIVNGVAMSFARPGAHFRDRECRLVTAALTEASDKSAITRGKFMHIPLVAVVLQAGTTM
jgi:hypothetical protein